MDYNNPPHLLAVTASDFYFPSPVQVFWVFTSEKESVAIGTVALC